MFWLIIAGITALFIIYVVKVLSTNNSSLGNSFDAFIVESDGAVTKKKVDVKTKYFRKYTDPGRPILILFGTEYGFSEEIARKLFDRIESDTNCIQQLWQPRLVNMKDYLYIDFHSEQMAFIIVSTAGDGVPPSEARNFFLHMESFKQSLSHLPYSVLALGDANYPHYCKAGKAIHNRFLDLGAKSVVDRVDIDQEDWLKINSWIESCVSCLEKQDLEIREDYLDLPEPSSEEGGVSRSFPFMATLKKKYDLTTTNSEDDKETIHCEFDLSESNLSWTSGDALGIYPTNCPSDVDRLLHLLGVKEDVIVPHWAYNPAPDGPISLKTCLLHYYDLKAVRVTLLEKLLSVASVPEERSKLESIQNSVTNGNRHHLEEYIMNHEVADVLKSFPKTTQNLRMEDLLQAMRPLQPRYYSISSSPLKDPNIACVTAAIVRYSLQDLPRTGVCTTYLQDRMSVGDKCPIFVNHNTDFRLPEDPLTPIIMIGPGTGIAPFRAFIQERETLAENEVIQLRVAFSRDQKQKIYVQHLIREDSELIFNLIEKEGAHIYICGDAKRMAHDVHKALCDIIQEHKGCNTEEATCYLLNMEKEDRYQKDVWVT